MCELFPSSGTRSQAERKSSSFKGLQALLSPGEEKAAGPGEWSGERIAEGVMRDDVKIQ